MSQENRQEGIATPHAAGSGDVGRQLSEQLKNAFIVALLVFWVSTLDVTAKRPSWVIWAIGSVALFLFIVFSYPKKKLRRPKLRWVLPFLAVGLLWLMYFLTGVSVSSVYFKVLAIVLILWTVPLFLALITLMLKKTSSQGKLDGAIMQFASGGDIVSWYLTLVALFFSVILGWTRLWNAGIKDWWMEPILIWGIIIFVVVATQQIRRIGNRNNAT